MSRSHGFSLRPSVYRDKDGWVSQHHMGGLGPARTFSTEDIDMDRLRDRSFMRRWTSHIHALKGRWTEGLVRSWLIGQVMPVKPSPERVAKVLGEAFSWEVVGWRNRELLVRGPNGAVRVDSQYVAAVMADLGLLDESDPLWEQVWGACPEEVEKWKALDFIESTGFQPAVSLAYPTHLISQIPYWHEEWVRKEQVWDGSVNGPIGNTLVTDELIQAYFSLGSKDGE